MKIYLSGVHGSGKSTLVRFISQQYHLPMISEVARMILSETELQIDSLRCDIEVVDRYQSQVFHRQLIEEQKHSKFVSDRCLLDCLVYSGQHSRILPDLMKLPELKSYLLKLRDPETCIFFVRPHQTMLKIDGVREAPDWDGVVRIDAQIKLLLEMFDIPHIQINTESAQERVRLVSTVLNKLM
jgi:predicted ATPase